MNYKEEKVNQRRSEDNARHVIKKKNSIILKTVEKICYL